MRVRDIMNTDVVTAEPGTPIGQVAKRMADADVGAVVIVEGGKPVGIVTDRDLVVEHLAKGHTQDHAVQEAMSGGGPLAAPGDDRARTWTCWRRRQELGRHKVGRLPVVEGDRLVGMLSAGDMAKQLRQGAGRPAGRGREGGAVAPGRPGPWPGRCPDDCAVGPAGPEASACRRRAPADDGGPGAAGRRARGRCRARRGGAPGGGSLGGAKAPPRREGEGHDHGRAGPAGARWRTHPARRPGGHPAGPEVAATGATAAGTRATASRPTRPSAGRSSTPGRASRTPSGRAGTGPAPSSPAAGRPGAGAAPDSGRRPATPARVVDACR